MEQALTDAIARGDLAPGTMVSEGALAEVFGTSRTPVRAALTALEKARLLERLQGRGYVVAGGIPDGIPGGDLPRRVVLTREMFGLPDATETAAPTAASAIARALESSLANALPYGEFRVNEQAAADHFGVSRTVLRELFGRFQDRGLMRKTQQSRWVIGPLTARDIAHYFAIREKLEPLALLDAARGLPSEELAAMWDRIEAAEAAHADLDPEDLAQVEDDLHVTLPAHSSNVPLLRMIRQSQAAIVVNRAFAGTVGTAPFRMAVGEHRIVLEFLRRGAHRAAAEALAEHLRLSAVRTGRRLMAISLFPTPPTPAYLRPIDG
ncbi:MAG: GntR family transcriptional regulator [Pseudomonadota bacterium]